MSGKEKYLRMGIGLAAGVAAFRLRKYRWAASVLASVAVNGIQAGIEVFDDKQAAKKAKKPALDTRRPDSSYL